MAFIVLVQTVVNFLRLKCFEGRPHGNSVLGKHKSFEYFKLGSIQKQTFESQQMNCSLKHVPVSKNNLEGPVSNFVTQPFKIK